MKKRTFQIDINATAKKVYQAIIEEESAKEWISVFSPNSYFSGSWDEGEKITFLTPNEEGNIHGMICTIAKNIPNKEIFIQPCGIFEEEQEILAGEKVKDLDKTYEKYRFVEQDGITTLHIEAVFFDHLESFFNETWPTALEKIKEMCE